jgi:type IV secretion system protein VirD4
MTARRGGRSSPGGTTALAQLAGLAVAVVVLLWLAGAAGTLLTGHQPPRAGFAEMGAVAVRLLQDPGDPAAAWPSQDRSLIPGPTAFYAVLGVLSLGAAALAVALWHAYQRLGGGRLGSGDGASWAGRRDLRTLVVRRDTPLTGRIVLGRTAWRQTIATPHRHSLLVFGPTLSGKTSSFVVPTLLRWRGPVIATSSKVDMLLATLPTRRQRGRVWLFDPFVAAGMPAIRWSPLVGSSTWPAALDMAYWLTQAASVSHSVQNAEFWETLARTLLAPLLYAAANDPTSTMSDVLTWANQPELADEVFSVLDAIAARDPTDPGPRLAHAALSACVGADTRRRDSIYGTTQVLLDVYRYPAVAGMAAGCDIDRDQFLQGIDQHGDPVDNTVFVYSPEHRQDQLRPLIEAFVSWLIRGAENRYALTGLALDPPLLLLLDEAGNIAPLRQLGTYASSLASQGCQLVSVFQNLSQIRDRYGPQATTIVTNHLAKVLMAGTTDVELLNLLTHLLGKQDSTEETIVYGPDGSRTSSTSIRQHELAPIHTLVQQRPGQVLALLSHTKPVRLHVRPYTQTPDLSALLPEARHGPVDRLRMLSHTLWSWRTRPSAGSPPGSDDDPVEEESEWS